MSTTITPRTKLTGRRIEKALADNAIAIQTARAALATIDAAHPDDTPPAVVEYCDRLVIEIGRLWNERHALSELAT